MAESNETSVGAADGFPVDAVCIVSVSGREIGVVRRADGRVDAVRNHCPHKAAQICKGQLTGTMLPDAPGKLTWGHEGEVLRCPWHGFEFDIRTGARLYSDSRMRLRVYPARIRDGQIWLDLGPQRATQSETGDAA